MAFVICLMIDKFVCSNRFNSWLLRTYIKSMDKVPIEQQEKTLNWLKENIVFAIDKETPAKLIISIVPADIGYKLNEKKLRVYMHKLGHNVLSNCFLDPDVYAVTIKSNEKE